MKKIITLSVLICLIYSCSTETVPLPDLDKSLAYEVILENHLSYAEVEIIPEQYLVFKKESDWHAFIPEIEQVNPYKAEHLKSLSFDFSKYNLIIIVGKYYSYCCSKINIHRVYKENEDIVVKYNETGPGMATAISQAFTLLKISKVDVD